MHHAVKRGHVGVIELLLERVPEMLNQPRNNGQTPLFDAFEHPLIVQLLLRRVRSLCRAPPAFSYGFVALIKPKIIKDLAICIQDN